MVSYEDLFIGWGFFCLFLGMLVGYVLCWWLVRRGPADD